MGSGGGGAPNKLLPFGGGGLYSVVGLNPVGGGYDTVWYGGGGVVVAAGVVVVPGPVGGG
jgi:hypothetical protein